MAHAYTIHLEKLILWGHHGLYAEEIKTGQWFEIDIDFSFSSDLKITSIEQTIDYSKIYALVKQRMHIATPLLETLSDDLIDEIIALYPAIDRIKITIFKQQPPIVQFQGRVGVTLEKKIR
jgi:dihydroneopterin aldolase